MRVVLTTWAWLSLLYALVPGRLGRAGSRATLQDAMREQPAAATVVCVLESIGRTDERFTR